MTKSIETIVWQHFAKDGSLGRETTTRQTLYRTRKGLHVNYLEGTRTVREEGGRFVAFGSKRLGPSVSFDALMFDIRQRLYHDAIRDTGVTPCSDGTGNVYGSPKDPNFPGEDKVLA